MLPAGTEHPRPFRCPGARGVLVRISALAVLSFPLILGGCGETEFERIPLGDNDFDATADEVADPLPIEIQEALDAANEAYRARNYEGALARFEEVTRREPELAAGWYGIGMTQMALGNASAADSAMMRVHRLAPELPLEHPATTAPPNPHPAIPPATPPDEGEG